MHPQAEIVTLLAGLLLLIVGIVLWIVLDSQKKARAQGLDKPLNLSFVQEWTIFMNNPAVTAPLILIVFGFISIIASIFLFLLPFFAQK